MARQEDQESSKLTDDAHDDWSSSLSNLNRDNGKAKRIHKDGSDSNTPRETHRRPPETEG